MVKSADALKSRPNGDRKRRDCFAPLAATVPVTFNDARAYPVDAHTH